MNMWSSVAAKDRGKQRVNNIQVKEPTKVDKAQVTMSNSNIELEKKRKEREEVAKKLEMMENEATIAEMHNRIKFLKTTSND